MKFVLFYEPGSAHLAALQAAAPGASFDVARDEPSAHRAVQDADAVLGNRFLVQSLPYARSLRWIQSNSMGVDRILAAKELLGGATLTCARGVYDDEIAEHVVALLLALVRSLHRARDAQRARQWERTPLRRLRDMDVLVLGWGGVGRAIGRSVAALGARVEGVRRRHEGAAARDETGFVVWGATWREALPRTDALVLALPLTRATVHLVAAGEVAALRRGAFVVNVGRGGTVHEDALVAALRSGHLGGAALDVFEEEPLAVTSPLWREPGLLVSAHSARSKESPPYRWEPLFVENVRRFAAGEPLLNVVDPDQGY